MILKSINEMHSHLSQTNELNTSSLISKHSENRDDDPVDSSVITASDKNVTKTIFNWDMGQRVANSYHSHRTPDRFTSNEDDDIAVAERLHFLVTEVVRASATE